MTPEVAIYLTLGAVAGGFINGLSGSGTALFALGFYLVVLPPETAVALVALMAVIAGIQGLWVVRHAILDHLARLLRFVVPGVLGVPLGVWVLGGVDAGALRLGVAVFLVIYGGYFTYRAALPAFDRPTPLLDCTVGALGGVLGGTAGLSGALPAMWMSLRPWSKFETRAVLQPFNMVILCLTVGLLGARGAYAGTVPALLLTIPCGLLAAQGGILVFRRLSDTGFRRVLIVLTLAMGLGVGISEMI